MSNCILVGGKEGYPKQRRGSGVITGLRRLMTPWASVKRTCLSSSTGHFCKCTHLCHFKKISVYWFDAVWGSDHVRLIKSICLGLEDVIAGHPSGISFSPWKSLSLAPNILFKDVGVKGLTLAYVSPKCPAELSAGPYRTTGFLDAFQREIGLEL